jgi:hypothetical protein
MRKSLVGFKAAVLTISVVCGAVAAEREHAQAPAQQGQQSQQSQQSSQSHWQQHQVPVRAQDQVRSARVPKLRQAAQARAAEKADAPADAKKQLKAQAATASCTPGEADPACGTTTPQPRFTCGNPNLRICSEGVCDHNQVCGTNPATGGCGCVSIQ